DAEPLAGEVQDDELGHVGELKDDPIVGAEPQTQEVAGHARDACAQLGVCQTLGPGDEGRPIPMSADRRLEHLADGGPGPVPLTPVPLGHVHRPGDASVHGWPAQTPLKTSAHSSSISGWPWRMLMEKWV